MSHSDKLLNPPAKGNAPDWLVRHYNAILAPMDGEKNIIGILESWAGYADEHRNRFESSIGDDYVLGPPWANIGTSARDLLNGECGRLDCGTLDAFILDTLHKEGFDENGERQASDE